MSVPQSKRRNTVRSYRGHGKRDIGDVYERYEVDSYLREDARAMRALLPTQGLRLEA